MLVDGSIQVVPLPTNVNIRLVAPSRSGNASSEPVRALLEFGYESQCPSKDGRVHDTDAALGHLFDQVAVGEAVADVLAQIEDDRNLRTHPMKLRCHFVQISCTD